MKKKYKKLITTDHGKHASKPTPVKDKTQKPLFGFLKGTVVITDDIVKSTGEKWEADTN